jgi:hypothetical protein
MFQSRRMSCLCSRAGMQMYSTRHADGVVDGRDGAGRIPPSQTSSHGNSRGTPPTCAPSSALSGPKKVPLEYGRVRNQFTNGRLTGIGTNSTFAYSVLFEGIQTWLSSLFAATFALPDPTLFDILDSPTPGLSLAAALSATAITALILAPLDIYRITYQPSSLLGSHISGFLGY